MKGRLTVDYLIIFLAVPACTGIGVVVGFLLRSKIVNKRLAEAVTNAEQAVSRAEESKNRLLLEAKEQALSERVAAEAELGAQRSEVQKKEQLVDREKERLTRWDEDLGNKDQAVVEKEAELDASKVSVEELKQEQLSKLEDISGLSLDQAKDQLAMRAERDMKHELDKRYFEKQKQVKEDADKEARKIVVLAVHRLAADVVSENSVKVVPLPNEEMKGRVIGREGRNIRAIEKATGVDVIIDETPEAVTISCFDPIRREVARMTVEKLVSDGRISPPRIEEVADRAREELDEIIVKSGEEAVFESGVKGLAPELIKLLGRLKFRTSYGENVLRHSIEVSFIASMIASEIGCDIEVAKTSGLLHDIGKALTHEVQGGHAEIGAEIAQKYGIGPEVHRAIMEHHDEERGSIEAFIVAAADAISAARPGARKDSLENYVKRLTDLEDIANEFDGIEKSYAVQAGREVRVMVKPEEVDDVGASALARDVVKEIEGKLAYPGEIKVTVVRETRSIEYAR